MRIPSKRKAISPVLATVILIAITLIAAVAIATFVFGIFGTSASPATMSIQSSTVACWNSAGTGTAPVVGAVTVTKGDCAMKVQNTGTQAGSINGAGPSGQYTGAFVVAGACASAASCSIPANSNGNVVEIVGVAAALTSGQAVTGYLTQANGPNLIFTVIVT